MDSRSNYGVDVGGGLEPPGAYTGQGPVANNRIDSNRIDSNKLNCTELNCTEMCQIEHIESKNNTMIKHVVNWNEYKQFEAKYRKCLTNSPN